MKLQPSSRKEIKRISIGIAVCDIIMIAGLFLLSQFGIGTFSYRIFVGTLGGSIVAILNFTIMCLTVQYATNSEKMALTNSELSVNSLYNTYKNRGLPLGPICNPSTDAIVAALYPDEQFRAQNYLYFCSTDPNGGGLHFSKTQEEHDKAVAIYRPLWEEYDKSRGL